MRVRAWSMSIVAVCGLTTACGSQESSPSHLSIRYGEVIEEGAFPAVTFLGSCTGTFVSPTTVLTAKHCVGAPDRDGRVTRPVRLPRQGNVQSLKVFANPAGSSCCTGDDVAVVVFAEGTALDTVRLQLGGIAAGDEVTMVGYGGRDGDGTAGPFGIKRKGTNRIGAIADGMIQTAMPQGAGLAPGDSGGPLFAGGNIVGIASSGDGRSWSRHVDLSNASSLRFLRLAVAGGADIPGL